ncbi:MAG TPA: hypothetical protein VMW58_11905 [Anaerolineae bacterium]|nr:hypothetical protein [Anaerolineae bacterium]
MSADQGAFRKVLLGMGAVLLISLMVLASFSLGVYVGHQGLLVGSLGNFGARPEGGQRPSQSPSGQPEGLPEARPQLVGRMGGLTNEGLFVRTADGLRLVQVNEQTRVRDRQGGELPLEKLRHGVNVAVFGEFSEDGRTLTAHTIILVPLPLP